MKKSPPVRPVVFTSRLEHSGNRLWKCHFRVPDRIVKNFGSARRVVCVVNNEVEYQTALMPAGEAGTVIRVNQGILRKLGLSYGMKVDVSLKRDKSDYGLPVPEELIELFRQDPEGDRLFHALTRGKQRTLLFIVNGVKNPDRRLMRANVVLRHLKAGGGKIDYKLLNREIGARGLLAPGPDKR